MRKARLFLVPAVILAALLYLPACSDDDDPAAPSGGNPPELDLETQLGFAPPAALTAVDDPRARELVNYISMVGGMTGWMSNLEPPPQKVRDIAKAGPWVRTWSHGEGEYLMSYRLTITERSDHYVWTLHLDGTDGAYTYVDALFYQAAVAKNETWGWFEVYDVVMDPMMAEGEPVYRWEWEVEDGVLTWEMEAYYDGGGTRVVLVGNPDGSGTLESFTGTVESWVLERRYTWAADGSGTWTRYNPDGSVADSGDWGGGGDEGPVVTAGMEGTWDYATTQTICGTGTVVYEDSGTEVLCAGDAMIDEEETGFLPCTVLNPTASGFRVECSDTYSPYDGCLATIAVSLDVTYSDTQITMTGRLTTTYTGTECMGYEDECYDVVSTGQRLGDAPAEACTGTVTGAAVTRWLADKVADLRP